MTDEEREYYLDLQHDTANELPDSLLYALIAACCVVSLICAFLVGNL